MPDVPGWLKKGAIVNVLYWVGHIDDVAVSDERIMVLVRSTKGIWRNHPAEWLEFKPEHIRLATEKELADDTRVHRLAVVRMLEDIDAASQDFTAKLAAQIPAESQAVAKTCTECGEAITWRKDHWEHANGHIAFTGLGPGTLPVWGLPRTADEPALENNTQADGN